MEYDKCDSTNEYGDVCIHLPPSIFPGGKEFLVDALAQRCQFVRQRLPAKNREDHPRRFEISILGSICVCLLLTAKYL